jgi:hypothetical protein
MREVSGKKKSNVKAEGKDKREKGDINYTDVMETQ